MLHNSLPRHYEQQVEALTRRCLKNDCSVNYLKIHGTASIAEFFLQKLENKPPAFPVMDRIPHMQILWKIMLL